MEVRSAETTRMNPQASVQAQAPEQLLKRVKEYAKQIEQCDEEAERLRAKRESLVALHREASEALIGQITLGPKVEERRPQVRVVTSGAKSSPNGVSQWKHHILLYLHRKGVVPLKDIIPHCDDLLKRGKLRSVTQADIHYRVRNNVSVALNQSRKFGEVSHCPDDGGKWAITLIGARWLADNSLIDETLAEIGWTEACMILMYCTLRKGCKGKDLFAHCYRLVQRGILSPAESVDKSVDLCMKTIGKEGKATLSNDIWKLTDKGTEWARKRGLVV